MKIKNVHLLGFKRFTNLTITDIPETVRLVMLVGPNGSGKSSVLDGFNSLASVVGGIYRPASGYYDKAGVIQNSDYWGLFEQGRVTVNFHDANDFDWRSPTKEDERKFYIRTGYRYEAAFTVSTLSNKGPMEADKSRPIHLMALDSRVANNYERLIAQTIKDVFAHDGHNTETVDQLRERIVGRIGDSFARVLPDAKLISLGNPLSNGSFYFEKGSSKNWAYQNLSAGEKAAFDLVLDFVIKSEVFDNTIYCIDEPEVHVNTNIHSALLAELYNTLPGTSQLWVATHSAGMMRKARELEENNPGTVAFLDFGGHDFDQPVVLKPAITNRQFWQRNFSNTIGELASLVAPAQIFFCEGDPNGRKKKEFDARCYTAIFANEYPDTVFLSVGSSNEVKDKAALLSGVFSQFLPSVNTTFIVDRDDCTESERLEVIAEGNRILAKRHLEAYLLDDEILEKFCTHEEKAGLWPSLQAEKQRFLAESIARGNPTDDWKSTAEHIRVAAKRILSVNQIGLNADAFMREHLVPRVTPETIVYRELRREIFLK
ncbi:AAA family ATPase [Hymenobacter setariae]|uniref:AAA family ATPase n=1 Tax=Hymenobacter setariae TaxID=2594794 RepID=A0A558BMK8_9BACT|nr:AAA family ATPase [Hymenobacter setariae]TVT37739.1 AAA family ATPase [Hymenobacter setariae]